MACHAPPLRETTGNAIPSLSPIPFTKVEVMDGM